jgi:hypothetical protein
MKFPRTTLLLAAGLAMAAAAPALAQTQGWTYRGGPKAPPSLSSPDYADAYAYYGGDYAPYGGGPAYGYGGAYAYSGPGYDVGYGGAYSPGAPGYYGGYGYGTRANEPLYRCTGPATSDCYNSRALQGTRWVEAGMKATRIVLVLLGVVAVATPAMARHWHYRHHGSYNYGGPHYAVSDYYHNSRQLVGTR